MQQVQDQRRIINSGTHMRLNQRSAINWSTSQPYSCFPLRRICIFDTFTYSWAAIIFWIWFLVYLNLFHSTKTTCLEYWLMRIGHALLGECHSSFQPSASAPPLTLSKTNFIFHWNVSHYFGGNKTCQYNSYIYLLLPHTHNSCLINLLNKTMQLQT